MTHKHRLMDMESRLVVTRGKEVHGEKRSKENQEDRIFMRQSKAFHLVRMRSLRSGQQNWRQRVHWDRSVKDIQCLLMDFSRAMGTYEKSVKSRKTCPDLCFI